jgi:hypothetical protein
MAEGAKKEVSSIAELMGQLSELSSKSLGDYKTSMSAAQSIQPIDSSVLQRMVSDGGALSSAKDFATSNVWTMTPDMFKQTIQNRPDNMKLAADATSLSDMIFGRSKQREASMKMAEAGLTTDRQNLADAGRLYDSGMGRQSAMERQEKGDAAAMARTTASNASREKIAGDQLALEKRKVDILMKQAAEAGQDSQGIPNDPQWAASLDNLMKMQNENFWDKKTGTFNFSEVGAYAKSGDPAEVSQAKNFMQTYMQRMALGRPRGEVMESGFMKQHWGGMSHVYLTDRGWYGVEIDPRTNKIIKQTQVPVVSLFGTPKKSGS